MTPNPVLTKLGLSSNDRVAIIHADDIGMCQAGVDAFSDLVEAGIVTSGAVMVPCPWFLHAARFAREHPDADLGVHLTITSEWETYRWGPVSTRDPGTGLLDEQGYFPRTSEAVQARARPDAVVRELQGQVERAIAGGMVPTHIDTHMGSVAHAKLLQLYADLALSHSLPAMILRLDEAGWRAAGFDVSFARLAAAFTSQLEEHGLPLLDGIVGMPLDSAEDRIGRAKAMLSALRPGITHFVLHPARDTPELRAIAPDWRCRVADYEAFQDEEIRKHLGLIGVHTIGYRALRDIMPRA